VTYKEKLQHIVSDYRSSGEPWPVAAHEMAVWTIESGKWHAQQPAMLRKCAEELSDAMREEYLTDPQRRRVRSKHLVRCGEGATQVSLWEDIRTASREHMGIAFDQRRQQILADWRQLKTDIDSYNNNYNSAEPLQMIFDFTNDLAGTQLLRAATSA
jgi:hypothetical protein